MPLPLLTIMDDDPTPLWGHRGKRYFFYPQDITKEEALAIVECLGKIFVQKITDPFAWLMERCGVGIFRNFVEVKK